MTEKKALRLVLDFAFFLRPSYCYPIRLVPAQETLRWHFFIPSNDVTFKFSEVMNHFSLGAVLTGGYKQAITQLLGE